MCPDGGPAQHAALQPPLSPRELPDEVLHVPRAVVASAVLRGRGPEGTGGGLRPRQNGGGDRRRPSRTHHLIGCQEISQVSHAPSFFHRLS